MSADRIGIACVALTFACILASKAPAVEKTTAKKPNLRALLVACTKYPTLTIGEQLEGPGNDVTLIRQLLIDRFQFDPKNIAVLSEAEGQKNEKNKPFRAHIVREFKKLIRDAKPGDRVVILLAGHGSQQPDDDPDNPEDPEPDGLDELFLPSDIGEWLGDEGKVKNAIVDDEIRAWLTQIRSKGAAVWFIADSCHSGTLSRGISDGEKARHVSASRLKIPQKTIIEAEKKAIQKHGKSRGVGSVEPHDAPTGKAPFVALYGAQSDELAYERWLPRGADDRKSHGMLSFTITQVLQRAKGPLTYRQLVHLIHQQYIAWEWSKSTPLVEGDALDSEVLGDKKSPQTNARLKHKNNGELAINAGTLHGMHTGTVLAVFPPAGQGNSKKPLGHVMVTSEQTLEAVVEPVKYAGLAKNAKLPNGAECRIVFRSFGDFRLAVAVDTKDLDGKPVSAQRRKQLTDLLKRMQTKKNSLVQFVENPKDASWRLVIQGKRVYLVPPGGLRQSVTRKEKPKVPLDAPAALDDQIEDWLKSQLGRIARVRNLMAMASESGTVGEDSGINLQIELLLYDKKGAKPKVVKWDRQVVVRPGQRARFRVTNRGTFPVDVTLLFINDNYKIDSILPLGAASPGIRLNPGSSATTVSGTVEPAAAPEKVVVIAVKSRVQDQPVSFGWLEQPSLEKARDINRHRGAKSPLQALFEASAFAGSKTRGFSTGKVEEHAIRITTWRVRNDKTKTGKTD